MTFSFDATTVAPQAPRDDSPLPAGLYTAEITGVSIKDLKKGGRGLNLEYTVIDPAQHAKRKVWQLLCYEHDNQQTVDIARAQLSALCHAVNVLKLSENYEAELFGRVVRIRTKIRPAHGDYGPSAEVSGYEAAGAGPVPQASTPAANTPAPSAAVAPPWAKKAA